MNLNQPLDRFDRVRALRWDADQLHLLDQRKLPFEQHWLVCDTAAEVATAITDLVVRGAPAIGIAAAYGAVLAARHAWQSDPGHWRDLLALDLDLLAASRPTAVNLFWVLARVRARLADCADDVDPGPALLEWAMQIESDDLAANRAMALLGAALLPESPSTVITHCNTGSLATAGLGTALGVIRAGYAAGRISDVMAGETRPWLQGARLTAWELQQDGIPVRLMADAAAAHRMRVGGVGAVLVGADRIAANGDVANKIGTYALAVLARHHGVPFYVVAPWSTVDLQTASGTQIPIEQRAGKEMLELAGVRSAAPGVEAWNPVFDVTPAALITAIVTERGVVRGDLEAGLRALA